MKKKKIPYGTWPSQFSALLVGGKQKRFGHMQVQNGKIYWVEGRPEEGGRGVLMVAGPDKAPQELTPPEYNVKSKVHEYGGGDFVAGSEGVFFVNAADQDIYEICPDGVDRITNEKNVRFADLYHDLEGQRLLAVAEDHLSESHLPENKIVEINLGEKRGEVRSLISGEDFYSNPAISPCGRYLSYISWSRPYMPWEATCLHVTALNKSGDIQKTLGHIGGVGCAVFQPVWRCSDLYFVWEKGNWNNIAVARQETGFNKIETVWSCDADFGRPQWVFGQRSFGFVGQDKVVASYFEEGQNKIALFDLNTQQTRLVDSPFLNFEMIDIMGDEIVGIATTSDAPQMIVSFQPSFMPTSFSIVQKSAAMVFAPSDISQGKLISYPTRDGTAAYGLYYPPQNSTYEAENGTLPPVILSAHGGPTGMADRGLKLKIQYWTSRGFAFLDVDYRGSSAYGKKYRESLNGAWGKWDVEDVIDGALWCVEQGLADGEKLVISGSSAGGLTVLNALAHHDVFRAGACYYPVSDLQALCDETHKFEIDYVYSLTGTSPETASAAFKNLSPQYHFAKISAPVVFFQGEQDPVVPAHQTRHIFSQLKDNGNQVAYTEFKAEGHGFRQDETLKMALSQEYYFYGQVLGFQAYGEEGEDPELEIYNL